MPNGEVLHPFNQQNMVWDDLWLEYDCAAAFVILDSTFLNKDSAADIAVQLEIGHDSTKTIEGEEEKLKKLRFANSLFIYSESAHTC
jgi:hypothetical protein